MDIAGKIYNNVTTTHEKMKDLKRKLEELNALKEDTESRRSTELHPRKKLKKKVEIWFTNVERINGEILDLEQKVGESNAVSRGWGSLIGNVLKKIEEVEELLQHGKFPDGLVVGNPGWIGQALSTTTLYGEAAANCMEEIWAYLMDDDIQKIGVWGMGGIGKTTIMKLIHNQLLNEKFSIVIWVTVSKESNISKIQNRIAQAMKLKLDDDEDEAIRAGKVYEMLARKGKYVLILDDLWDRLSLEEVGIPEPSKRSKLLVTTRSLDVCRFLACREVKVPTLSKPDARELFLEKVGRDVLNHPDLLTIVESVAEECAGLPLAIVTIASSMRGVRDIHVWRNALRELKRQVKSVNGMEEKVFQQLQFSYDRLRDEKVKHCFLCCALYPEDFEIDPKELIQLWIAEGLVEEMDSRQMEIDKGRTILNNLENSCLIETVVSKYEIGGYGGVKLHDVVRDMALRITSVRPRFLVRAGMQLKEIPDVQHWKEDLEKASLMENRELLIPPEMPPPRCPNLTTLLLHRCGIESIPEGFFEQMHGLKILDLSYNHGIKSLPNSISNLKTLTTLLLYGCESLEKVPSFSKLEALKKLDLAWTGIEDIPDGMEKLVNLKYLDLTDTQIEEMDDGIMTKLTSLQQLRLTSVDGAILVRGEEIGGLRKLEIFEGGRFHDLNELNNYGQALQLARTFGPRQYRILVGPKAEMSRECYWKKAIGINGDGIYCTHGIKIPSDVEYLAIRNITVHLSKEEEKEASFCSGFIIPVPYNIFSSLSRINIWKCKNIKKLFSSLHSLPNLEQLRVEKCYEMEEIIASESEITSSATASASASFKFTVTLPKLQELFLWDLLELKSLCGANVQLVCDSIEEISIGDCPKIKRIPLKLPLQDDGQPSAHPSLKRIEIRKCKNIKKLFSSLHSLPNLEDLTVEECDEVEEIIASESEITSSTTASASASFKFTITLPKLRRLTLKDLPELKSICGANVQLVCDSIEDITLMHCPKVKRIPLKLPLQDDGQPSAHPSLKRIEIRKCKNIKKLFSSLHSLPNLEDLTVEECDEVEEIIASESEITSSTTASASFKFTITLPKLHRLTLKDLPELKSICGANVQLVCDSIAWISVSNCPKIKRIPLKLPLQDDGQPSALPSLKRIEISEFKNIKKLFSSLHSLQNLGHLRVEECDEMEEIIASESEITSSTTASASASFKFTIALPKLRRLTLKDLPELKSICAPPSLQTMDISSEEYLIPVPHNIFFSLSWIEIRKCKNIKKLFSPKWVLHSLQNLKHLTVEECYEMEEIIASESEITSSTTASASFEFTITLPELKTLCLSNLPELKSICGANVQLVCDSIEDITLMHCPKIKRIPLKLPLQDDGQPSSPPSLEYIVAYPEEWWGMVEWDHPNAKSLLEPYLRKLW